MKFTFALVSAALLNAGFVSAEGRRPFGNGGLPEILQPFDVDGDGRLSVEERQAFVQAVRDGQVQRPERPNPWDTNGDGVLSDEERAAAQEAIRARIEAQRTARFEELDADDDGFLTSAELGAIPRIRPEMVAALLERLDANDDGKVSLDEFLAGCRPPSRPPGGGGGGGERPGAGGGDAGGGRP